MRIALLLLPVVACAQIDSLATDADGSRLWFNSGYALRGSGDVVVGGRVYAWNSSAPEIVAQATDFAYLGSPFISSDGKTSGWQFYYPCRTGSCGMSILPRNGLHVTRAGKTQEFVGVNVFISRNGRYLVQGGTPPGYPPVLTDLDTGSRIDKPDMTTAPGRHGIADDGSLAGILRASSDTIVVAGPAAILRTFQVPGKVVYSYAITDDARLMFVQTRTGNLQDEIQYAVIRIDLASGAQTELLSGPDLLTFDISGNGARVLLTSEHRFGGPGDLLLWDGQVRKIATAEQGYKDLVVSDDGTVAYVVERSNRLLKVNLSTVATEEVMPPFPSNLVQDSFGVTPGSAVRYSGFGLTKDVELDSEAGGLPVIETTPVTIYIQVPWEIPQDVMSTVRINKAGYPFETSIRLYPAGRVAPWIATIEQEPYYRNAAEAFIKAAQPDFKSLVSMENPALPGSTIHTWLTGLGPLDKPVPTGAPGPDNPPARPLAGVACYLIGPINNPPPTGIELPFVAYAPGLIGVYQVDMTIPKNWPAGPSSIRCESSGQLSQYVKIQIGLAQ